MGCLDEHPPHVAVALARNRSLVTDTSRLSQAGPQAKTGADVAALGEAFGPVDPSNKGEHHERPHPRDLLQAVKQLIRARFLNEKDFERLDTVGQLPDGTYQRLEHLAQLVRCPMLCETHHKALGDA